MNLRNRLGTAALSAALVASTFAGLPFVATPAEAAVTPCPAAVVSAGVATVTCAFTGAEQTWTVPAGVTSATFDVQGAAGGSLGGLGGRAVATLAVPPGAVITVFVGGAGPDAVSGGAPGGFNGGGSSPESNAASGGGGSDVRVGGTALADRAVIGGGGGGRAAGGSGGTGGGTTGGTGGGSTGGAGGNQDGTTGSGVLGTGGSGLSGGGGGGGYWGGAGDANGGGGGGGGSGKTTPDGAGMTDGYRAGNGQVVITYTVPPDTTAPTVTCSASPATLKSNKHKLASITTTVNVTDAGSGSAGFTLLSVTSNQAGSGLGGDDLPNDIQSWTVGTADTSGLLRTERYGGDRVYTLTYEGSDVAGNTATCVTTVTINKGM